MSVELRKAASEDTAQLAAMSQRLSEATASTFMPLTKHITRVRREMELYETALIFDEGRLVGYLMYLSREDPEDRSRVVHLHRLFIEPTERRRGTGRKALEQVLEPLASRTQVFLAVKPGNKAALAFYKALSFEVTLLTMKRVV